MQKNTVNNFVYLSYGKESERQRALFSILSLLSYYNCNTEEFRVVVYTDVPEFFEPYLINKNVEYYLLTPEILNDMLNETGYIHRRKVAVIDLTAKSYPTDNLFFIDSDTFFISDPTPLLKGLVSGVSYMHKREYTIGDGLSLFSSFNQGEHPQAFVDYISKNSFMVEDKLETYSVSDYCWNSGVLGLHHEFYSRMPDVYKMTDVFYANSKWFISEQLAFSFILQRKTEIRPSDLYVMHYWGKRQKILLDGLLTDLFKIRIADELRSKKLIKSTVLKWRNAIDNNVMVEQAVISISSRAWYSAMKNILKIALKNPFNFSLYIQIKNELRLSRN